MMADALRIAESWTTWYDELPAGWSAAELRRVAEISASNVDKISQDGEMPVRLCNYTNVYYNDLVTADLDFMEATATASEIARFQLRGGEVLLTKDSETAEDIAIPSYVMSGLENVVCGYHLYLLRPDPEEVDGRFLMRACSVSPVRDQFVTAAIGITRFGLGQQDLGSSFVPVPPLPVQRKVADFLDCETAKIDRLIEEKQRLIELLEEKRTALITKAVSKGLDPAVEKKDSGVEWLGEIPAHWEVTRLKHVTKYIIDGVHSTPQYVESGVPFVTVKNLTAVDEGISFDDVKFIDEKTHAVLSRRTRPEKGDILLSKDGTLGVPRVVDTDRPFNIFVSVALLKPLKQKVDALFLRFALESDPAKEQFRSRTLGSALTHLHLGQIANVVVSLPPLREQHAIASELRQSLEQLRGTRDLVDEAIDLLREYRSVLISAAVTGKIDVQDHAA